MSDDQRLSALEIQVTRIDVSTQQTRADVRQLKDYLLNGTDGKGGLLIRVDRLEQIELKRNRHFWLIWGSLIGLIASDLWPKMISLLST